MLSQDPDFLSKCLDFLKPAPSLRSGIVRAARVARASSPPAHGRPPLPAPRSPPVPRLAAAAAGGHSAFGQPGPRPPPRPLLPAAPSILLREPRSLGRGGRGAGVCGAVAEPAME